MLKVIQTLAAEDEECTWGLDKYRLVKADRTKRTARKYFTHPYVI